MAPYSKPLPKLNGDNRPFWEGCNQHELRFQQCPECGHVRWPPSNLCPQCHCMEVKWVVSQGIGKVYSYAVCHALYHPGFADDLPYVVAVVALDDGPHVLTNIVGCLPREVKCNMPVQVVWEKVTKEITLPKFKPLLKEKA